MPEPEQQLLPAKAIELLLTAQFDPSAERQYDAISGGLHWSDEMIREAGFACVSRSNWAFRFILAFRASLIRGMPDERFRPVWDQLKRECPAWPGFRAERCASELRAVLESDWRRFAASIERAERDFQNGNSP